MAKAAVHKITPYIIMDFETGGVDMSKCALTEVALIAVKGDTFEKICEYETLIAPHKIMRGGKWYDAEYTDGAERVTGLTQQILKTEGKNIDEVAEEVQACLIKANVYNSKTGYKPVLVGQNPQFEVMCLQNLANGRFDLSKYFHGNTDFHGNFQPHYIDTIDLAKLTWNINPRMTNFKLETIMERAGIPIYDAHRAMNDVRPTSHYFESVAKMLRAADKGGIVIQDEKTGEVSSRSFKFQLPQIEEE